MLLVVVVGIRSIWAQSSSTAPGTVYPIDLSTALQLAGAQNLKIAAAKEQITESSAHVLSAYERFLPTLSADWRFVKHVGLTQGTEGEFVDVTKQFHQAGGGLSLTLDLSEALFEVLSARQRRHAAQSRSTTVNDSVFLDVGQGYFDLELASALVRVAQHAVAISADLVSQTAGRIEQGIGYKVDLLRARAQLAHDSLLLRKAEEKQITTSAQLAALLNLDEPIQLVPLDTTLLPIAFVDTSGKVGKWLTQASRSRPELRQQRALLSALKWEKTAAIWGPLLPEIVGNGHISGFGPSLSTLHNSEDYSVGVRWTVGPGGLLDFGRVRARSARVRMAKIESESVANDIAEAVKRAYGRVLSRGRMLSITRQGLDDARLVLHLSKERKELGVGLALEVIDAAETLSRAEHEYAETVIEYNKAQLEALSAIGLIQTANTD